MYILSSSPISHDYLCRSASFSSKTNDVRQCPCTLDERKYMHYVCRAQESFKESLSRRAVVTSIALDHSAHYTARMRNAIRSKYTHQHTQIEKHISTNISLPYNLRMTADSTDERESQSIDITNK